MITPYEPVLPNQERARFAILLFRIFMALLVINALIDVALVLELRGSYDGFPSSSSRMLAIVNGLVALLRIACYVTLIVFFIMWMRRAYHNLHKSGSTVPRHSEGWAAGAWFVPILNLFYPLQIMRDIWQGTQDTFRPIGQHYTNQEDNITGWWWALFLVSGFVAYFSSISSMEHNFMLGYFFAAISDVGYIFAGFLATSMIRRISGMETEMYDRAQQYYAWVSSQYAQQYMQQQQFASQQPPQQPPFPPTPPPPVQ